MTARPAIILHGGFHKTATSHIQSVLARNAGMLERNGVRYVHHRDMRKRLTVPVQYNAYDKIGMNWKTKISDEELHRMSTAFFAELTAGAPGRIILSDENIVGHCGHCVRWGLLYRWRRQLIEGLAAQIPGGVDELHLGVRNYADFFASAYVEYLRSVTGSRFVDEAIMRRQVLEKMPSWQSVLNAVMPRFPGARVIVWRYEDFQSLQGRILANLCGPDVDVGKLKLPKNSNKRPTASGRAVAELLQLIHARGADHALAQRVALQEKYPRGKEYAGYDPWTPAEREHLSRVYERDLNEIRANPSITFLEVENA